MIERIARAVAAGVVVGVIVQEAVWAGLGALRIGTGLDRALVAGPDSAGIWPPLLATWLVGGFSASLMATLIGRGRGPGHAAGALMSASAWCMLRLAWSDAGALLVVAATPSLGAALGTAVALRFVTGEAGRPIEPSVVTLRAFPG